MTTDDYESAIRAQLIICSLCCVCVESAGETHHHRVEESLGLVNTESILSSAFVTAHVILPTQVMDFQIPT